MRDTPAQPSRGPTPAQTGSTFQPVTLPAAA